MFEFFGNFKRELTIQLFVRLFQWSHDTILMNIVSIKNRTFEMYFQLKEFTITNITQPVFLLEFFLMEQKNEEKTEIEKD